MLQLTNLSGRRESKEMTEAVVIASPVKGEIKISPVVARTLNVADGDNVVLASAPQEDGTVKVYIAKGKNGEPALDEAGEVIFDKRGRQKFEENSSLGSIARPTTASSNVLKVTVTAAWVNLGGDENMNRMFKLGEGTEAAIPTNIEGYPQHVTEVYELIFDKEDFKSGYSDEEEGEEVAKISSLQNNEEIEEVEEI